jgi:hypothetical protein
MLKVTYVLDLPKIRRCKKELVIKISEDFSGKGY